MRATTIDAWMTEIAETVKDRRDYLTQLDAAIGDGDHGVNMDRGFDAVGKALAAQDGSVPPGKLLVLAGKTLVSTVGGASGPLWGTAFRRAGRELGDGPEVADRDLVERARGRTRRGDRPWRGPARGQDDGRRAAARHRCAGRGARRR